MKKIEMIVERTKTSFYAYASKYPAYTTGRNLPELKVNMLEALNAHFEDEDKIITEKDIKVSLILLTRPY